MRKEECFFLGTLSSLYSYKGEILINIDSDEPELYTQLESILVDYPTGLVPFLFQVPDYISQDFCGSSWKR